MEVVTDTNPIGVIDSGVGGLTVSVRLVEAMPDQPFLYFADQAWCPYGPRPAKEVRSRLFGIVDYLLRRGCKLIVVACNTATAAAIAQLRTHYNIPFIGMEPAIKPAALTSQTHHVGVLATLGTFSGALFQRTAAACAHHAQLHLVVGEGLVEIVESGRADSEEAVQLLRKLLAPLLAQKIDRLVLGCTHYPLLRPALERVLPLSVQILDPAPAIARQSVRVMHGICSLAPVPTTKPVALELLSSKPNAHLLEFAQKVFDFYNLRFPTSHAENYVESIEN